MNTPKAETLPEPLAELLHAALDERRDPLDDARIVAWLDAHPHALEAFAMASARQRELPSLQPVASAEAGPRRRRAAAIAGVMLTAAVLGLAVWRSRTQPDALRPLHRANVATGLVCDSDTTTTLVAGRRDDGASIVFHERIVQRGTARESRRELQIEAVPDRWVRACTTDSLQRRRHSP